MLQWLQEDFMGYLQEWESSVQEREGDFTQAERNKMQLSHETLQGLKITGILIASIHCSSYSLMVAIDICMAGI